MANFLWAQPFDEGHDRCLPRNNIFSYNSYLIEVPDGDLSTTPVGVIQGWGNTVTGNTNLSSQMPRGPSVGAQELTQEWLG
mmetsp:Transcript_42596/g.66721  ORF Transcript_42596/g.66721 Transcript_42596/m.66721 type:complete len:81 (+) Transcript_42596:356-598(+)